MRHRGIFKPSEMRCKNILRNEALGQMRAQLILPHPAAARVIVVNMKKTKQAEYRPKLRGNHP